MVSRPVEAESHNIRPIPERFLGRLPLGVAASSKARKKSAPWCLSSKHDTFFCCRWLLNCIFLFGLFALQNFSRLVSLRRGSRREISKRTVRCGRKLWTLPQLWPTMQEGKRPPVAGSRTAGGRQSYNELCTVGCGGNRCFRLTSRPGHVCLCALAFPARCSCLPVLCIHGVPERRHKRRDKTGVSPNEGKTTSTPLVSPPRVLCVLGRELEYRIINERGWGNQSHPRSPLDAR